MKKLFNKLPANIKITLSCIVGLILVALLYYPLIPILLNYPPDSINNSFQIEVNYFYYTTQYITVALLVIIILFALLPILFRKINKIANIKNSKDIKNDPNLQSIIKTCFNFPFVVLLIVLLLPPIMILILLVLLKQELIFSIKTSCILFTMTSLISLFSYSTSRAIFEKILKKIEITDSTYGIRFNIQNKLLVQLLPLLIFTVAFAFLILYSQLTETRGNFLFDYYKQILTTQVSSHQYDSIDQAIDDLKTIPLKSSEDSIFILSADGETYYSEEPLSDFFREYFFTYENVHDGHTYDYYGMPIQGSCIRINIADKDWIIGIKYVCFDTSTINSILPLFAILFIINLLFILYLSNNFKNELKVISENLGKISDDSSKYIDSRLYVFSNDEIADLTIAFNRIQTLTKNNIDQIHENQDMLMEKERLASLGQLIGGIAHNLKTPIMSISGAAEGLNDLVKEYNTSIEDPEVTAKDHHDIAKDMNNWISKIKTYTEYMSDVITAVKGQAVTLSSEENTSFSIDELIKRVNILMKHELKNALIDLNLNLQVDSHLTMKGDVNSLVQVINNMISNSIQSYNGKTDEEINVTIEQKNNSLVITIQDHGCGMPKDVKDKLFKEMITTKGKNGTGLGLFMSYSTIRAHFAGNITFDSEEGKGTTFIITLPIL